MESVHKKLKVCIHMSRVFYFSICTADQRTFFFGSSLIFVFPIKLVDL